MKGTTSESVRQTISQQVTFHCILGLRQEQSPRVLDDVREPGALD
jgi:hypothetical protein